MCEKGNADRMAAQRHLMMKHRRIVSDTSALHLPMSLVQPQLPQHGTFVSPANANHHDAALKQYVHSSTKYFTA